MSRNIFNSLGEYLVPKGSNIGVCPYFMARDPTLWDDPLKFDPERFSSDKQLSHPYLYTPFSAGPRYDDCFLIL